MKTLFYTFLFLLASLTNAQSVQDYITKAETAIENNKSSYTINKYLEKALKLEPKNQKALYLKGSTLSNAKHYKEALSVLNTLILADTTNTKYYHLRSKILVNHGYKTYQLEAGVLKA